MAGDLLAVLGSPTRRRVIAHLRAERDESGELRVAELVDGHPNPDELRTELYHADLPKLAQAGLIDWDRDRDRVAPGNRLDDIAPLVDAILEHQQLVDDFASPPPDQRA